MKTLVSACLLGTPCRYDGRSKPVNGLYQGEFISVCPEVEGGLSTPRPPAEIIGGDGYDVLDGKARVVNSEGADVTEEYVRGAEKALEKCRVNGVCKAILKAKSPSCGSGLIYDGSFSGCLKRGDGVAAALLKREGITVITEEDRHEGK